MAARTQMEQVNPIKSGGGAAESSHSHVSPSAVLKL